MFSYLPNFKFASLPGSRAMSPRAAGGRFERTIDGKNAYIPKKQGANCNPCGFPEVVFENRRLSRAKQQSADPCRGYFL